MDSAGSEPLHCCLVVMEMAATSLDAVDLSRMAGPGSCFAVLGLRGKGLEAVNMDEMAIPYYSRVWSLIDLTIGCEPNCQDSRVRVLSPRSLEQET